MRHVESERRAAVAAEAAADRLALTRPVDSAMILGTGWAGAVDRRPAASVRLDDLPGFSALAAIPGHARALSVGGIGGRDSLTLSGRVHLNERLGHDPDLAAMVRLQTELLIHLGARRLIVTSAAGSLNARVGVGDLVLVDGFVSLFAPPMPLWAGEFCSPDDALSGRVGEVASAVGEYAAAHVGGYAMVRGPFFEGRRYDKAVLAATGAAVVGMSVLPEACVAALYAGVEVLAVAHVTNTAVEAHSHDVILQRAQGATETLRRVLGTATAVFLSG